MGIGTRLKEAREEKGLSLESLQETTKIQKRYLRAIEEENFSILPGKFYARAFIKEYAVAVNLNVDELFEEYKDDLPQPEEHTSTQYTRIQRTRKENSLTKNSALFSIIPTIIVVLLIIGVFFAVWFFMFKSPPNNEEVNQVEEKDDNAIIRNGNDDENESNNNGEEDNEDVTEEDNLDTEEEGDELELNIIEDDLTEKPETVFELNNVTDDLTLTLESSGETWLEVVNNEDEQLFYGILSESDSPMEIDISNEKEIYFSVGNASVLDITFNDLDLEYPEDPNENVVQKFWVNIK